MAINEMSDESIRIDPFRVKNINITPEYKTAPYHFRYLNQVGGSI